MKKIILLAVMFILYHTCIAQTYTLNGKIKGLTSDSLLLIKVKGKGFEGQKIKVTNGSFAYTESIKEPYFVQLFKLKNGKNETDGKLAEFMVAPGLINVFGDKDEYDAIKIEGSKPDKILKAYFKEDKELVNKWEKLKEKFDAYTVSGDTLSRKKVGASLNDVLLNERVPLLKKYVGANSNTIVGALLPNFCTLSDVLKKEDYLEMYQTLTNAIQHSDYGQNLFHKIK